MDYRGLSEQLVKKCLARGADAAEVYVEASRNLSIQVRNGEVETVEEAATHGVGLRVFSQGRMAFASCNDFRQASLDDAVSRAIDFARCTTADEHNLLPDDPGVSDIEGLFDPSIGAIPTQTKVELAKAVEKQAMLDGRITKSAGSGYFETEGEVWLANSFGLSKNRKYTTCTTGVSVVAEKDEQRSSGGEYCNRRFFADLLSPERIGAKAARNAYELLDPRPITTRKAAVIFDPDVAFSILGGIVAALDGERVLQGASFLGGLLEKRVASPQVTLIDDGTRAKGLASAPFDAEGVPTRNRVMVDQGVLKDFLYNTIVARRAGVQSTGNALRDGFSSLPGIGPHNFYMAAGPHSPEQIVRATQSGLLLKEVTGYGINPVNGQFSGGASGLWIEGGEVVHPVRGVTIAGSAEEMLGSIDLVGNDLDLNRRLAAPTFRIPLLQIGAN